jgi:hypothetical protein
MKAGYQCVMGKVEKVNDLIRKLNVPMLKKYSIYKRNLTLVKGRKINNEEWNSS